METYKDSNIEPEIGDVVLMLGVEVTVTTVRLDRSTMITDCSSDGKLCLDTPSDFQFIRRKITGNPK